MTRLKTTEDVVAALGGTPAVSRLTGRGITAVCNWRARNVFPPNTYALLLGALRDVGKDAPGSLWGMTERPLSLEPQVARPDESAS